MKKDKVRIAVIGASGMAMAHMRGVVENKNSELAAICDIRPEVLNVAQNKYNAGYTTTDYRDIVKDPDIDGVVIVTPDQLHLEMTEAFLRAGKAVLCEKPMALNMKECEDMMRVEKETGNMLMIGQICRCTPAFIIAQNIVASG